MKDKFKLNTVIEVDEEYNTGRNKVNNKEMFSRSSTSNLSSNFHIYSKTVIELYNNYKPSFIKINQKTIVEEDESEEQETEYCQIKDIHKKYGEHFRSLGNINNNFLSKNSNNQIKSRIEKEKIINALEASKNRQNLVSTPLNIIYDSFDFESKNELPQLINNPHSIKSNLREDNNNNNKKFSSSFTETKIINKINSNQKTHHKRSASHLFDIDQLNSLSKSVSSNVNMENE